MPLAARARLFPALAAVYRAQLSRARVARIPLLFVATFQSIGIMILMRGVVDGGSGAARSVVAGSSVLVVAFVALNLLAQYFGQLRASGGLDHYATLPVPPSAVVLGAAAAYASFTVPGNHRHRGHGQCALPTAHDASVDPPRRDPPLRRRPRRTRRRAGAARPASGTRHTVRGQLGMSAALLLGVLPADRMPQVVSYARDLLPSTYGVEALAGTFDGQPDWWVVGADLWGVRRGGRGVPRRRDLGLSAGGRAVTRRSERPADRSTPSAWHDDGVTAPLTPHDPPPPHEDPAEGRPPVHGQPAGDSSVPNPSGYPQHPEPPSGHSGDAGHSEYSEPGPELRAELVQASVVAIAVAVSGVLLGVLLWLWLAPKVPLVSDGTAVYLKNSEGEDAIGADSVCSRCSGSPSGPSRPLIVFLLFRHGGSRWSSACAFAGAARLGDRLAARPLAGAHLGRRGACQGGR
ncbi:hypothetical protein SANTM175S_02822 [Streptomyces antimycoticus]